MKTRPKGVENIKDKDVLEYIAYLEKEAMLFEEDMNRIMYKSLYAAHVKMYAEISGMSFDIDADKDDKGLDRFIKINGESKKTSETMDYLKDKFTTEEEEIASVEGRAKKGTARG